MCKQNFGRQLLVVLIAVVSISFTHIALANSGKNKSKNNSRSNGVAAVTDLIHCYARGTDEIGDATTNADPLAAGIDVYRRCFTRDASFNVWFPQQEFDQQQFPDAEATPPTASVEGYEAWAEFVDGVFRGNGYDFTQHMITNVEASARGNRAKLTASLNASHVISGDEVGGLSRCVAVANGTYSIRAVKRRGRWRAVSLDLTLVTFNPVFESGSGCAAPE